jgi:CarD family transcriptional regulator
MSQKNLKKKPVNNKAKATQTVRTTSKKAVKATPMNKATPMKRGTARVVSAPVVVKKEVAKAVSAKPIDKKAAAAKVSSLKALYKVGNYVVYPTHGVGKIMAEETQMIGEIELRMLVISFEKDKMTLRVPLSRASAAGLRPVSSTEQMRKVFLTLKSRARTSRGMWSRRAQEYETKINSGNIHFIAEVVRDLHQNVDQSERSYSERMIYESALSRLVGELAACEGTDYKTATDKLMKLLRAKVAAAAEALKEAA